MSRKLSVRVPDNLFSLLEAAAKKRHTTVSGEVTRFLTRQTNRDAAEPESPSEETEQRLVAHLKTIQTLIAGIQEELRMISKMHHSQLAITNGLVKLVLSLIPEPADLDGARRGVRKRYETFIAGIYKTELEGK